MYFEMAARDIRALPKLEGTVHVNIALIVKFMPNYFFNPGQFPEVPRQSEARNDDFLFQQGPTRGLGKIQFHDYAPVFDACNLPNVNVFKEQIALFKESLMAAPPAKEQQKDIDFLLSIGELFTLVVYGQLVLENARIYGIDDDLLDQIFDFMVRDFSKFALQVLGKPSTTPAQAEYCRKMIMRPVFDAGRYGRVWGEQVLPLKDAYEMSP